MKNISFDKKGFLFSLKFLSVVLSLIFITDYFSSFYFKSVYVVSNNTESTNQQLKEIKANRKVQNQKYLEELTLLKNQANIFEPYIFSNYELLDYIPKEGKFVAADLENMKVSLYEDSKLVDNFNILSKGKDGSRWETPGGLYKITTKEKNHFSSLGKVYMPYSMQFFGNFFIHGWPYYPNGTPVEMSYSGGCLRLSTESARRIFNFVDRGTSIFVYEEDKDNTLLTNINIKNIPKPFVTAKSVIVANINNSEIYFKKDSDLPLPIASITKLITALVSNETISYGKKIRINDHTESVGDSAGDVKIGDIFSAEDLIYPLLMESNNTVAYSLADYYGYQKFVGKMNEKSKALGLYDTRFVDPSGISASNISTVDDLFRLSQYLYEKQSFVLNVSKTESKNITSLNNENYIFHNFNIFSKEDNYVGGKTGFTNAAGETMISLFDINTGNSTSTIAIIVLDSENREKDINKIKQWFLTAMVPNDDSVNTLSKLYLNLKDIVSREEMLSTMLFWR